MSDTDCGLGDAENDCQECDDGVVCGPEWEDWDRRMKMPCDVCGGSGKRRQFPDDVPALYHYAVDADGGLWVNVGGEWVSQDTVECKLLSDLRRPSTLENVDSPGGQQ